MKTHPIVAAPWQLNHDLKSIILPLDKYFNYPVTNVQHNGLGTAIYNDDFVMGFVENLFAVGDRIYLQEEWCKGDWGTAFDDDIYFTKSTTPEAENIGWQSAETMPPEAAQYWFEVTGVEVVQMAQLTIGQCADAGFVRDDVAFPYHRDVDPRWLQFYSGVFGYPNRWVVVLGAKKIDAFN